SVCADAARVRARRATASRSPKWTKNRVRLRFARFFDEALPGRVEGRTSAIGIRLAWPPHPALHGGRAGSNVFLQRERSVHEPTNGAGHRVVGIRSRGTASSPTRLRSGIA